MAVINAFPLLAQCIRSDQISPAELDELLRHNPFFAAWYARHFLREQRP